MPHKPTQISEQIDALLPQTQCGACGYPGCKPYAEAIANHEVGIDRCAPGGMQVLCSIAQITQEDPIPFIENVRQEAKPDLRVEIQESACIGCTKCIQACPVDAIIGAPKHMHTVLNDLCTGCGLCIPPCPVDCIDIVPILPLSVDEKQQQAAESKHRYLARNKRLKAQEEDRNNKYLKMKRRNKDEAIKAALNRAQKGSSKET